jgi:DNA-binding PucR family transcriptional regulator
MNPSDATFDDTGITAPLLRALAGSPEQAAYYRALLEPLRRYDREQGGDLLKTLAAYVRQGGNSTRTADALFMHRNSLRYRLARIQALTGLDPDEPEARLALHVAVLLLTEEGEPR